MKFVLLKSAGICFSVISISLKDRLLRFPAGFLKCLTRKKELGVPPPKKLTAMGGLVSGTDLHTQVSEHDASTYSFSGRLVLAREN
ncbi:MAG: hypothetical protein R3E73_02035 [Porticoccaceae bacterium]